jgi:hypothetical protein
MLNYGYLTYQAERTKTQAEERETDAQLGQLSAAFAQLLRPLTKPARALRPQPGTGEPGLRPCMPADNVSYLPGLGTRSLPWQDEPGRPQRHLIPGRDPAATERPCGGLFGHRHKPGGEVGQGLPANWRSSRPSSDGHRGSAPPWDRKWVRTCGQLPSLQVAADATAGPVRRFAASPER